ncbi:Mob1/phocein [Aspergillus keveii]|uniref:Mob1/phocein n=1 Tax=Aspergillus keveii TaxID=714993 RepID=A0ABR4G5F9_9EURO
MNNASPAQSPAAQAAHGGHVSNSPSLASNHSAVENTAVHEQDASKYFFQEKYAPLNVKGNFLTLCACPKNVELGEWLAHQIVEQYRLLHGMLQVIQEVNTHTGLPICNESTCPTMSAGRLTYTWLVDSQAAKISAPKFINRVEKWIVSKIHDPVMFPTEKVTGVPDTFALSEATGAPASSDAPNAAGEDWIGKSSGFPRTFYKDCQGIMKQMFRCYAHLYHAHWLNPFWHINKHEILNMCFVHFVTVAKYYKLVTDKEMEPMQPLIDLFIKQQRIPPEALAGGHWGQQASS